MSGSSDECDVCSTQTESSPLPPKPIPRKRTFSDSRTFVEPGLTGAYWSKTANEGEEWAVMFNLTSTVTETKSNKSCINDDWEHAGSCVIMQNCWVILSQCRVARGSKFCDPTRKKCNPTRPDPLILHSSWTRPDPIGRRPTHKT